MKKFTGLEHRQILRASIGICKLKLKIGSWKFRHFEKFGKIKLNIGKLAIWRKLGNSEKKRILGEKLEIKKKLEIWEKIINLEI